MDMNNVTVSHSYCYDDLIRMDDIENRRLYINEMVNEFLIDSIVYHILKYNREDKGIPKEERKPIIIYINSPGGDVVNGYSVISACLLSITPVYTVNIGEAFSMALLIFLAGEKRFSFPYSEFLLHD